MVEGLRVLQWPGSAHASWNQNVREMEELYGRLAAGRAAGPSSRLGVYRRAFDAFARVRRGEQSFELPLAHLLLTVIVEFHQLRAILKASHQGVGWDERLGRLLEGRVHPDAGPDAASRDAQFECFLGAVACLAGYDVAFTEPDVLLSDGDQRFCLAAKRPRSLGKLARRFRQGLGQIQRSGVPGFVAIDASLLLMPDGCLNTNDEIGAAMTAQTLVDDLVREHESLFVTAAPPAGFLGTIVCVHKPMLNYAIPDNPQLGSVLRWTIVPPSQDRGERYAWLVALGRRLHEAYFRRD